MISMQQQITRNNEECYWAEIVAFHSRLKKCCWALENYDSHQISDSKNISNEYSLTNYLSFICLRKQKTLSRLKIEISKSSLQQSDKIQKNPTSSIKVSKCY